MADLNGIITWCVNVVVLDSNIEKHDYKLILPLQIQHGYSYFVIARRVCSIGGVGCVWGWLRCANQHFVIIELSGISAPHQIRPLELHIITNFEGGSRHYMIPYLQNDDAIDMATMTTKKITQNMQTARLS